MSNYPDDIRDFDEHPSSPFHEEPLCCETCDEVLEAVPDEDGDMTMVCPNHCEHVI